MLGISTGLGLGTNDMNLPTDYTSVEEALRNVCGGLLQQLREHFSHASMTRGSCANESFAFGFWASLQREELGHTHSGHNNLIDDFRHAYASFRMTQEVGEAMAKAFMDAHQISSPNPLSETAMDLWNNAVGRKLAMDSANSERDPSEVIAEALNEGLLVVKPLDSTDDPAQGEH